MLPYDDVELNKYHHLQILIDTCNAEHRIMDDLILFLLKISTFSLTFFIGFVNCFAIVYSFIEFF